MSKEMIISVNGREKKIAITENGQVTEFYIERDEDNSGVVGNIYKGRVQRVLPGMQSAFVDIGLERDAFLYVSDFFDEEEEIERIVLEKSKQKKSKDQVERETTDELHKSRLKRDKQIDNRQKKAEIVGDAKMDDDSSDDKDSQKGNKQNKGRRKGRGKKPVEDKNNDEKDDNNKGKKGKKSQTSRGKKKKEDKPTEQKDSKDTKNDKDLDSSKDTKNKKYNRNKKEAKNKESKKEAKVKETETKNWENALDASDLDFDIDAAFKKIADEDDDTGEMLKDAMIQEAITDKVRSIEFDMESTDSAEVGSLINSVSDAGDGFERIADEDEQEVTPKPSKRKSRSKKKTAKKTEAEESKEEGGSEDDKKPKTRAKRKRSTTPKKRTTVAKSRQKKEEEAAETEDKPDDKPKKKSPAKRKTTRNKKTSTRSKKTSKKKAADEKQVKDAEASETETNDVAEMAVRRGSRGGRNRNTSSGKTPAKTDTHKDKSYKTTEGEKTITADSAIASAEFKAKSKNSRGRGRGRRNNKPQPKITDLLHEGQEIIVQIAKEPIAKKGARITSHIALPGRFLVYMPTIEHLGVSRKIESAKERSRLRSLLQNVMTKEDIPSGGFIVRTAGTSKNEQELREDARYLTKSWNDLRKDAEKSKSPKLIHQDLDIIQRLLRDQLSDDFTAIRVDSEEEYLRIIEFINRIQPQMVKRVKFHTFDEPILDTYGVSDEIDKALKHRVWLKSGGYLVINQTEALIAIDVNTGKFVGKGNARLEDTITKTNMEAVMEISRQIRLRDLGGIIVLDLIDMEDRNNRKKVLSALQDHLAKDKSPTKVLSFNDFGLIIMTRKRVKQSLERTLCSPCSYCEGAGWIKSASTICYEILVEARRLSKGVSDVRQTTLRVHPNVAETLRKQEKEVLEEIEDYLGIVDVTADNTVHQEQFDFAFI